MKDWAVKFCFMVLVFVLATASRGEWLLVAVYLFRDHLQTLTLPLGTDDNKLYLNISSSNNIQPSILEKWRLQNLYIFLLMSCVVSFVTFYSLTFGWHWYYYVNRRHKASEWKCQADKFLTPDNERHEMLLGSVNMFFGSIASGIIACYISNGGYSMLYYTISDRGWLYFIFSIFACFMYNETMAYYIHRSLHLPLLYRTIHKMHHRYHQPTAWSATAMHPIEFILYQGYLASTPFLIPIHPVAYIGVLLYTYYYGMCDHSGIKMKAIWPWQPHSQFHDNHHKYFHTNFGVNTYLFDWLHDTMRKENRVYGEDVFGGHGKQISSISS